jgi:dTMP kinase
MADRSQHCQDVLVPALRQGKIVLCDRFVDSSVAYQGYGRGLDINIINQLNDIATSGVSIDLTLFLDLDVGESFGRRIGCTDRIECLSQQFFDRVRYGFVCLASKYSRIVKIDASQGEQVVHNNIVDVLQHRLHLV